MERFFGVEHVKSSVLEESLEDLDDSVNKSTALIGSLSKRIFETRTATGSDLFYLLACLLVHIYISEYLFSIIDD